MLAQRWGNVRASAEAAQGNRYRAGRAHLPNRELRWKLSRKFIGKAGWDLWRFRFWGEFPNSTDRNWSIAHTHTQKSSDKQICFTLVEHFGFLEPYPYHGLCFAVWNHNLRSCVIFVFYGFGCPSDVIFRKDHHSEPRHTPGQGTVFS